ncbi:MAG: prepilin-type N-terminal cleavage/methylation domain-containing protein [Candidatus Gracilibacteria bacterium]|nr:prepilin-type N-terminal cleavage/methylation domain-containing protein [Candidatus Gracilibacteria bacterium]
MKNYNYSKSSAFSIIEVLIGIFIFTMGLLSVYMLLQSSFNMNEDNKNRIVAANLAREGIELVRNIRDSNYKNIHKFNQINPKYSSNDAEDYSKGENIFQTGVYYKVGNNFNGGVSEFPIKLEKISNFGEGVADLEKMDNYRLCLDTENKYSYCDDNFTKKTNFYRYIKFDDLTYDSGGLNVTETDSYTLDSKVLWYAKGLHELDIKTILTDYKKL